MRQITMMVLLMLTTALMAQSTDRKMVVRNSADGESEMTVYLPVTAKATGKAVMCCPGGGYYGLAIDHEGHQWAEYFNSQGIAFAVLKYRMPNGDRNIPLGDAYNGIKTLRDSAAVWNINPRDVGIMGFSAGGHLASAVSTHAQFNVRPNFSILFYPVISMDKSKTHQGSCINFLGNEQDDEKAVRQWSSDRAVRSHITPPAIVLTANGDRVVPPVTNGIAYYTAMRNAGNSCALHVYPKGNHGFGFSTDYPHHDQVLNDLTCWLNSLPVHPQTDQKIACVGNSITDGHGIEMRTEHGYPALLERQLGEGYEVKNFGVSSRTMMNCDKYPYQNEQAWRDCLDWEPDVVVIKLGTNDSKDFNQPMIKELFAKDMQTMIDSLRALPSNPRIVFCTPIVALKPSWTINDRVITEEIIPIINKVSKKNKCEVLDLHTLFGDDPTTIMDDGIHPNEKGCAKMAEIIKEYITTPKGKK